MELLPSVPFPLIDQAHAARSSFPLFPIFTTFCIFSFILYFYFLLSIPISFCICICFWYPGVLIPFLLDLTSRFSNRNFSYRFLLVVAQQFFYLPISTSCYTSSLLYLQQGKGSSDKNLGKGLWLTAQFPFDSYFLVSWFYWQRISISNPFLL